MSCSRCRKDFLPSSSFCFNCGLYLLEGSSGNHHANLSIRNAQRREGKGSSVSVKVSDKPAVSGTKKLVLDLPSEVLQSVDTILNTPVVAESALVQRKEHRFRAQVYELKNAEDMEFALGRRDITGGAVNRISGNLSKGLTDTDARPKLGDSQYLSDVVSVASHYKTYLRRLKELEGLHVAMVERPKLPSEILSSKPR